MNPDRARDVRHPGFFQSLLQRRAFLRPLGFFAVLLAAIGAFQPALPAAEGRRATVVFVTNEEGAHLGEYLAALTATAEVGKVILVDSSGKVAGRVQAAFGTKWVGAYPTMATCLASHSPDLTLVSLEPKLAPDAIEAALDAGSAVMAEKPACLSVDRFAELARKAEARKLPLMLAMANRLNPETAFARDFIQSGKLGKVYGIETHTIADQTRLQAAGYQRSWFADKSRAGGGHLIWLGIHWVDLAMYLTGSDITEVTGFVTNVGGQPVNIEDSAVLGLKFSNGALGTLTSGYYLDQDYDTHIKIWGSKGWIEINIFGGESPVRYYSTDDPERRVRIYRRPEVETGYTPWIAACVRASLGRELPPITASESVRVLRTIFAFYRSAESGKVERVLPETAAVEAKP